MTEAKKTVKKTTATKTTKKAAPAKTAAKKAVVADVKLTNATYATGKRKDSTDGGIFPSSCVADDYCPTIRHHKT